MADTGIELKDEFMSWLEEYPPTDRFNHELREDEEYNKRRPFTRHINEEFITKTESFNKAFDLVLTIRNKETGGTRTIYPIEFKSNRDKLDERLPNQIATHLFTLGKSVVVLDSKIGYEIQQQKNILKLLPSALFIKKAGGFIRLTTSPYSNNYPEFYADTISQVLPKGYKQFAPRLKTHLNDLNSIMKKLYVVRLVQDYNNKTGDFMLTEEELNTLMALIVKVSATEAYETFNDITQRFRKMADKIEAIDIQQQIIKS